MDYSVHDLTSRYHRFKRRVRGIRSLIWM